MVRMKLEDILWILIDLKYVDTLSDLNGMSRVSKYFRDRIQKTKFLKNRKDKILKYAFKWKRLSTRHRISNLKIIKSCQTYHSIFSNKDLILPTNKGMIAAIWVMHNITNFHRHNPEGYTWTIEHNNEIIERCKTTPVPNKWIKLPLFAGGALYPSKYLKGSVLLCPTVAFVNIVWVETMSTDNFYTWLSTTGWQTVFI